jgi:CRP-like cAMP-binding protein
MSELQNALLRASPDEIQAVVLARATAIDLPLGGRLFEQDGLAKHVWFIESGMVSAVGLVDGEEHVEIGLMGREGLAGLSTVLGSDRMATAGIIQQPGRALRLGSEDLQQAISSSEEFRKIIQRYTESMIIQISQTAACNARHDIEQRLARWLLLSFDRVDGNELAFTHDFLSWMLGVRRAGVTTALHVLEGEHAIRASRKKIALRDRQALERLSCTCYRDAVERAEAIIPGFQPSRRRERVI